MDKPRSNCGVIGVFNHPNAAVISYYALHSLQHRGQEAAGILSSRWEKNGSAAKRKFSIHKDHGLVLSVFQDSKILTDTLAGDAAIAHNRYSTTGASGKTENIQPFYMQYRSGNFALAHNGNLTNTATIRRELNEQGTIFQTSTDSELILHLVARSNEKEQIGQIRDALRKTLGSYSLVMLTDTALIAARDPHGIRPLAIGRLKRPDGEWAYMVASETCAFDIVGAEYVRDVEPNEIVVIDNHTVETGKITSYQIADEKPLAHHCIFEYIYFARPDSKIFEENVDKVRRRLGKNLAMESPVTKNGDKRLTVINVPDSSNTATLGFVSQNNKEGNPSKYEIGLIRSHYVGRTFIQPGQDNREMKVKIKFNVVKGVLRNRKVVVVDDSIVRGTTSKSLVKLLREGSPKEVHLRITSPPLTHPCKYGMDFPSKGELIANRHEQNADQIGESLGVESLRYLSVEKLLESVPHTNKKGDPISYCTACFTGEYPVPIDEAAMTQVENDD
ncbi:MAG TPA: amidophosphoribosyltransferase [Candidatus Kapabacteria bacterium]|nr:amidophosphoribosyltransferase [Candidatus Kapabacteria bacterium]